MGRRSSVGGAQPRRESGLAYGPSALADSARQPVQGPPDSISAFCVPKMGNFLRRAATHSAAILGNIVCCSRSYWGILRICRGFFQIVEIPERDFLATAKSLRFSRWRAIIYMNFGHHFFSAHKISGPISKFMQRVRSTFGNL